MTLEAHVEVGNDGVVEHTLSKPFDSLFLKAFIISLPRPWITDALELLEEGHLSPVNEHVNHIKLHDGSTTKSNDVGNKELIISQSKSLRQPKLVLQATAAIIR